MYVVCSKDSFSAVNGSGPANCARKKDLLETASYSQFPASPPKDQGQSSQATDDMMK